MDKKIIKTKNDTLELYLNHFGHITISIEEISPSHTIDINGEWTDDDYSLAGISLDKDRAVELNTVLSQLIQQMFPGTAREAFNQQVKQFKSNKNDTGHLP